MRALRARTPPAVRRPCAPALTEVHPCKLRARARTCTLTQTVCMQPALSRVCVRCAHAPLPGVRPVRRAAPAPSACANGSGRMQIACTCTHVHTHTKFCMQQAPCVRALRARTPPRRRTRAQGCACANKSAPMQIACTCTHVHTHTNSSVCNRGPVPCVRARSARTISSARPQTRAQGCACPCMITYGLLSVCSGRHLRAGGRRKKSDKVNVGAVQCSRVTALCRVFFKVPRCAAGQ